MGWWAPPTACWLLYQGGADSLSLLFLLADRAPVYGMNIKLVPVYLDLGFTPDAARNIERMAAFFFLASHPPTTPKPPRLGRRHTTQGRGRTPVFSALACDANACSRSLRHTVAPRSP